MTARIGSALALVVVSSTTIPAQDRDPVDFAREVRPILSENCFQCHGPDDKVRKAKLRFDTKEGPFVDLGGYRAIERGKPGASEMIARITHDDPTEVMPPRKTGKRLTAAQIDVLRRWIAEGAPWARHWAYVRPKRPALPKTAGDTWSKNAIDRFVRRRLAREQLTPSATASPAAWLRRVTFDLTGLPPSITEIDAFEADRSRKAHDRVVDRLLASPRYGEHWARFWLDAARYADTNGYQYDRIRTQWPWRDWVINALNRNMPFDQFTIEQLAGDLLPNPSIDQRIATGFNRNHPITIEGGVIDEEYRSEYVVDRVVTTSTVWMGMTFFCARCHDHKYDPIQQKEFYKFYAFFNNVPERGLNGFDPRISLPSTALDAAERDVARWVADLAKIEKKAAPARRRWERQLVVQARNAGVDWHVVKPRSVTASSGVGFKILPDNSILARPGTRGRDTFTVEFKTDLTAITAIRIECLTHPSLPHNGPGWASNSNFVLTDFVVSAGPKSDRKARLEGVPLANALADHSQRGFAVARAIDSDRGSGWAVDGPSKKEDRVAVFQTARPFGFRRGTRVRLVLRHDYGSAHVIGRLRISLSTRPGIGLGDDLFTIARTPARQRTKREERQLREQFLANAAPPKLKAAVASLDRVRATAARLAKQRVQVMVMRDRPKLRATHVLYRGEYDKPRERVTAGVPAVLPPMAQGLPRNRLGLARWLVADGNPLTSRVIVNRYWQVFFSTGLVKTAEDFGAQGDYPSHPGLLDWLATEFVRTNWDVKRLHKLIVLSATYRQSSRVDAEAFRRDPENRLLARGPNRRLDAEEIRDQALVQSGLLIERLGGPSVYPYHPKGLWLEINNRPGLSRPYPHQTALEQHHRRSIYTFWKRTVPPPTMQAFDAPEREFCVVRRSSTNTPLQPFVMLHGPQFVEAARFIGARMMRAGGRGIDDRISFGFRLLTGRRPKAAELAICRRTLQRYKRLYRGDLDGARKLLAVGLAPRDESLDLREHAAWTALARMLLNLSEALTNP